MQCFKDAWVLGNEIINFFVYSKGRKAARGQVTVQTTKIAPGTAHANGKKKEKREISEREMS